AVAVGPGVGGPTAERLLQLVHHPMRELLRRGDDLDPGGVALDRDDTPLGLCEARARPRSRCAAGSRPHGQTDEPPFSGQGDITSAHEDVNHCATLRHGGSFRMVVVTAVLPWTAEGAAAPSSARQFNRRRDIPYAGDNLDLAAEADVAGSRNLALAQFPQACKMALRVVVEQERRTGVCPPGVGGGVTSSLRYCGRGHGRSGRSVRPGPGVFFAPDLARVVTEHRATPTRPHPPPPRTWTRPRTDHLPPAHTPTAHNHHSASRT